MKIGSYIFCVILLMYLLFSISCNQTFHPDTPAEYLNQTKVSAADYTRDSLYLAETFYGYIREDYGEGFAILGIKLFDEHTQVYVDTITYSPDMLKMVGLVVVKSTIDSLNLIEPWQGEDEEHFFRGNGLLGFRSKRGEPWKIYPYQRYFVSTSSSPERVSVMLRTHFFKNIYQYDITTVQGYFRIIGYNLDDVRFWDGPLWQKDEDKGLYPFQAFPYFPYNGELPYLKIDYPDSLLRLYGADE